MASFTDSITQFNPYVSQLPVDAMVKVGMYKQQQYDQGVQKIQSQIDNVAGMDVAKDSDKRYLQSKLNQLGSKLTSIAGGDFSNQQLVSAVGGMATQVGRDENVQNAVASTAMYKKQRQELDKLYKDGKSSVANVYDFTKQADNYLNNDEVGQRFNGRYSPYVDIDKKFLETFKALHASETGKDFIYERYTDPITGKLLSTKELAVAMEREGVEGIDAAKIQNALRATLTPDELNQMRINANYQFKDTTPDDLANNATKQYQGNLSMVDQQIERLEAIAALSDAQPKLQKRALTSIEELKASKSVLSKNYIENLALANDDPERARLNIYKEGAINQFANAFSWEKRTTQVLSNPQWEGQMQADAAERDKARLRLAFRAQSFSEMDSTRKFNQDERKIAADNATVDPFLTSLGEDTNIVPPLIALHDENFNAGNQIEQDITSILESDPKLKGNRAELQRRLVGFQNGEVSEISGPMRDVAQRILDNRKLIRENNFIENKLAKEVYSENPVLQDKKQQMEKELSSAKGLTLFSGGVPTKYSPKELYDIKSKLDAYAISSPAFKGTAVMDVNVDTKKFYEDYLKSTPNVPVKEKVLINSIINERSSQNNIRTINDTMNGYKRLLQKNIQFDKEVNEKIQDKLSKIGGKFVPIVENIDVPTAERRQRYEGIVGSILERYTRDEGANQSLSKDEVEEVKSIFAGEGKGDIQYKRIIQGGKDYLKVNKGLQGYLIEMTPNEASQIPTSIDRFGKTIFKKQVEFRGSTNPTGNVEDAEFQGNTFKNTRKYAVVADLKNNPLDVTKNYINLKIKVNGTWQPVQLDNNPMTAIEARTVLSNMNDQDIEKLLTSKGISFK